MGDKVNVVSMSNGTISLVVPELRLRRSWPKKGAVVPIERDILKEAMYEPGVEYIFRNGLLYIEDMEFKKEIGLEPEDATTPKNILRLDEKELQSMLSPSTPAWEFENKLLALSREQRKFVIDYAIENELFDSKKADVFTKVCNVDILRAISLKKANDSAE